MSATKIEWADAVWNPTTGCTPVSEGCENCYAKRFAYRLRGRFGYPEDDSFRVTLHPERLDEPLRWRNPKRVFVNSMGDLFHPDVPDDFIDQVFNIMALAYWHTFLVLTKRPARMTGLLADDPSRFSFNWTSWPLPNVWLGVSVENQQAADERIPILLQTPAAVRFVSVEPMLGPVDLTRIHLGGLHEHDALTGWQTYYHRRRPKAKRFEEPCTSLNTGQKIDWVICGGETGPNARPCHPDWVRSLRDQCQEAGVPFFFKQVGEWVEISADQVPKKGTKPCILLSRDGRWRTVEDIAFAEEHGTVYIYRIGKKLAGRLLDGREWNEFPKSEKA